ncbi:hypothetical protein NDU88_000045 [Pleurodeles waltl]|uniref:Uncharacterized protein n=1 Tax=Pleurodeles waltl TaxID=8319 RepID=A0AAV7Q2P1_PLEWA|nr:hypothetical protein NDU88_000045 [Pleurodeles waltl]
MVDGPSAWSWCALEVDSPSAWCSLGVESPWSWCSLEVDGPSAWSCCALEVDGPSAWCSLGVEGRSAWCSLGLESLRSRVCRTLGTGVFASRTPLSRFSNLGFACTILFLDFGPLEGAPHWRCEQKMPKKLQHALDYHVPPYRCQPRSEGRLCRLRSGQYSAHGAEPLQSGVRPLPSRRVSPSDVCPSISTGGKGGLPCCPQ